MQAAARIRVLVVDDSALMRKMIPGIISTDERLEVVGTAMDGDFALRKIETLRPDVVTLDLDMPRMDGLTALRSIVRDFGLPVILVSSLTRQGAGATLKGLEMGAFDFVAKPEDAISVHISEISRELIDKIKAAAHGGRPKFREPQAIRMKELAQKAAAPVSTSPYSVVAIGISTGGPQSLTEILPRLPEDFPAGILIVQHMPEGFTGLFARRLDAICAIDVKEAAGGDTVSPGKVLIAPGGKHMKVKFTPLGLVSVLSESPPVAGHRPSANVLFHSVAEEVGSRAIGVVMTGMGDDGVEGLGEIKEKGGKTFAQDEATSIIYGMPKVAIEKGYADRVVGLDEMVPCLLKLMAGRKETVG